MRGGTRTRHSDKRCHDWWTSVIVETQRARLHHRRGLVYGPSHITYRHHNMGKVCKL